MISRIMEIGRAVIRLGKDPPRSPLQIIRKPSKIIILLFSKIPYWYLNCGRAKYKPAYRRILGGGGQRYLKNCEVLQTVHVLGMPLLYQLKCMVCGREGTGSMCNYICFIRSIQLYACCTKCETFDLEICLASEMKVETDPSLVQEEPSAGYK